MNREKLAEILRKHKDWLSRGGKAHGEVVKAGIRAVMSKAKKGGVDDVVGLIR